MHMYIHICMYVHTFYIHLYIYMVNLSSMDFVFCTYYVVLRSYLCLHLYMCIYIYICVYIYIYIYLRTTPQPFWLKAARLVLGPNVLRSVADPSYQHGLALLTVRLLLIALVLAGSGLALVLALFEGGCQLDCESSWQTSQAVCACHEQALHGPWGGRAICDEGRSPFGTLLKEASAARCSLCMVASCDLSQNRVLPL